MNSTLSQPDSYGYRWTSCRTIRVKSNGGTVYAVPRQGHRGWEIFDLATGTVHGRLSLARARALVEQILEARERPLTFERWRRDRSGSSHSMSTGGLYQVTVSAPGRGRWRNIWISSNSGKIHEWLTGATESEAREEALEWAQIHASSTAQPVQG